MRETIQAVHASPARCVVVATGAGSGAIAWLLGTPGASATVLEALVPYAPTALTDFLGERPAHFVSEETAARMAARAYDRAQYLRDGRWPAIGLGCTGALATLRERRGPERVHVGLCAAAGSGTYTLDLEKGVHTREEEEEIADRLLVHGLALASHILPLFDIPLQEAESLTITGVPSPIAAVLQGRCGSVLVQGDGRIETEAPTPAVVFPGAFNPLHEGHRQLAGVASGMLALPVTFEISLTNVDKPPLTEFEAVRRARQFHGWAPVALTRAPTFREKARLFPGCTFVIGSDTAVRLVAPRYYKDEADMRAALEEIRGQGCRFLVAGRLHQGIYTTLTDVPIPTDLRPLFREIPASAFRADISSSELRARGEAISPPTASE